MADDDKKSGIELAKKFIKEGFKIIATSGTHKALKEHGIESEFVHKISEGRPNIADKLKNNEINLVVNTSDNKSYDDDGVKIRQLVLRFKVPYFTTTKAALMAVNSIPSMKDGSYLEVKSIQDYLKE